MTDPSKAAGEVAGAAKGEWDKLSAAYREAAASGQGFEFIGKALGQGAVLVGSALVPGAGEAGLVGDGARAAEVVSAVGKTGEVAGAVGKTGEVASAIGKTADVAAAVGKAGDFGESTSVIGKTALAAGDVREIRRGGRRPRARWAVGSHCRQAGRRRD